MTGMQYMNDLNAANVLRQLWETLPRNIRSKWTERVSKIRSINQQLASFSDFSQFVSQQVDLATDPEESISRSMDTVEKHYEQNERKPKRGSRTDFRNRSVDINDHWRKLSSDQLYPVLKSTPPG